jgi:hypothetical protein
MNQAEQIPPSRLSCTAFDHATRVASGPYVDVAVAVKEHIRTNADASVLLFDDDSGKQIDFDLRGTDQEIVDRLRKQFALASEAPSRSVGRPKLGVISREVTLMPHHWAWLSEQPGGASVALRRLVEGARRVGPDAAAQRRKVHERTYHFMSAMAGNFANFEDASRALFADNIRGLKKLIGEWPGDIRKHIIHLSADATER